MTLLEERLTRAPLDEIAAALATVVSSLDLDAVHPALARRDWVRLVAADGFDAWLIRWPPGGSVEPHDHGGAAGVVAVVAGELVELVFGGVRPERVELPTGSIRAIARDTVHDVVNESGSPAVSVHVYSPPLGTMGFFDVAGRRLQRVEPVGDEAPVWTAATAWWP